MKSNSQINNVKNKAQNLFQNNLHLMCYLVTW